MTTRSYHPTPGTLSPADQKRFWASVDFLGEHWWWTPSDPYLHLESGGQVLASYAALLLVGTPVPPGHNIRYLCSMGSQCISPEHGSIFRMGPWGRLVRERSKKLNPFYNLNTGE
jgi:hypothetical protein